MGEVGASEPVPTPKGVRKREALNDDRRHRETDEGEPGQRDEVDALEHGDARQGDRPERNETGEHRRAEPPRAPARHPDCPDVRSAKDERPDDEPVGEPDASVQKGRSDRVRGRSEAKRETAPEPPAVQLDRIGDELANRAVFGRLAFGARERHDGASSPL